MICFKNTWYTISLLDWVIILIIAISLIFIVLLEEWIPHHNTCLPGYDVDSEDNFICGENRNPLWQNPFVKLSVTSFDAILIGLAPFFVLFLVVLQKINYMT